MPPRVSPLQSSLVVAGFLLALASVAGLWWSAERAERRIRDDNDAALAAYGAAYLVVVTPPAPDGGLNARWLVSSANTLAAASFWPGGFQMAVGSVALVADTIGLLPLPDSVRGALRGGATRVITTHARYRVAVVPVPGASGDLAQGWAAAWRTLRSHLTGPLPAGCVLLAVGGLGFAALTLWRDPVSAWRLLALVVAGGGLGLLALALGGMVHATARSATAVRLLTVQRLVEIAATANGVKAARLPEIAVGLQVRPLNRQVTADEDLERENGPAGPVARIVAATPRNQGGLVLEMTPVEAAAGGPWGSLLLWWLAGAVGLLLVGRAAGLSGLGGLFHSAGSRAGPSLPEGRA
jgi:hypothetical protein